MFNKTPFLKMPSKRRFTVFLSFFLFLTLFLINYGCQKEALKSTSFEGQSKENLLTPQLAQLWFESNYGKSKVVAPPRDFGTTNGDSDFYFHETFSVTPKWNSSKISTYLQVAPVVIVPIEPIAFLDSRNLNYALVCFIDSTQNINARLQIYKATEKYKKEHTSYDVKTFSGMFFQIGLDGKIGRIYGLNDGQFTSNLKLKKPELNSEKGMNKNSLSTRSTWQGCWGCGVVPGYSESFPLRCFFCLLGFGENSEEITYDGTNSNYFYGSLGFGYPSTSIYPSATSPFDPGINGSSGSSNSDNIGSSTWGLSNEFDNSMFDINAELYAQQNKQNYVLSVLNPTGIDKAFLDNNKLIYNQLYDFLVQEGDYLDKTYMANIHLQQLMQNSSYFALNQQEGFDISVMNSFRKYSKAGFSVEEFVALRKDAALFWQVDGFLNRQNNSSEAYAVIKEIVAEYKNENYTSDVTFVEDVQLHLSLLEQSQEYKEFTNILNSYGGGRGGGDPMKDILLDLMLDGAQSWAENALGITDLSALRDLLSKGLENSEKVAFKATRIIARFLVKKNPFFNALSSIWKAKEVYKKINDIYKVYEQLARFNTTILEKLYKTLKETGGGKLLERIRDTNRSPYLDGHWDIDMGNSTVDEFIKKLANAFGKQWKPGNAPGQTQGNIFAQHLDLSTFGIKYFEYYPFSSSTGWASIDIVLNNGKQFKFRLGRL